MPYRETRRVSWGDCDPAGILYTPRVYDFCTEALENWYRAVLGVEWTRLIADGLGAPMVHTECDYLKPMRPGLELVVTVRVAALGRSSVTFLFDGTDTNGTAHFRARFVASFMEWETGAAIPVPEPYRSRIEAQVGA